MIIAYHRFFVLREALEGCRGRLRLRELAAGGWVRLVGRLGPGIFVAEPAKAPAPRTALERFRAGEPVPMEELLQEEGGGFERWARKHGLKPQQKILPSPKKGFYLPPIQDDA